MARVITDPAVIEELEKGLPALPAAPQLPFTVEKKGARVISDPAVIAELEKQEAAGGDKSWMETSAIGRGLTRLGGWGKAAYETAFPERDPATKDIPGFSSEGLLNLEDRARIERGKFTSAGFEDAPWKKRVLETLGERVTNIRKDKFGNEIIKYTGDDGQEYERYINRPGLDVQDINRGIHGAIPYVVAGGLARKLLPAGSLLTRAPIQAGTAAGVSLGQDIAAELPIGLHALGKATMTGAFGGGGEILGTVAPKVWRYFFQPKLYDEATGVLTDAGRKVAQGAGLNPDQIQAEVGRQLHLIKRAQDPQAAAAGIETGAFGIPTSLGQRSKDPAQLGLEEQMRRGLFGAGAKEVITGFDEAQRKAIETAAQGVRRQLGPGGSETLPEAGQAIGEGLRSAQAAARSVEKQAWADIGDLFPILTETKTGNAAREMLGKSLRDKFDDLGFFPDPGLSPSAPSTTPTALRMMRAVEDYSKAQVPSVPFALLGRTQPHVPALDNMRRSLLGLYQGATNPADRKAAKAIYDGFTDWMAGMDAAHGSIRNQAMQFVSKGEVAKIEAARAITKEQRQLFRPTDPRGKLTPAGKILDDIAENGDTPERVVQTLFGSGLGTVPKAGTVDAIGRLRQVLPPDKVDHIKTAYFLKMITGTDGHLLSPGRLSTSVETAFAKQKSVMDALFTPGEQQFMQDFRKAVAITSYRPANASGTSYELERMRRQRQLGPLHYVLKRLGTRSTFQGEIWQGTMYHWLARVVPNIFNLQDAASRSLARKAIGQTMEFKPDTGELAAALTAAWEAQSKGAARDEAMRR